MRLIQLAGAAGLALAGTAAQAETAPANVDRDLLAAIEDSMSDNPNIRGVCEGLAQAAAITGTGPISVAYPVNEGVTEDEMKTAVQACLDWDYSRSADTSLPNALIAPVTVTHVEFTDSGIRMTIAPEQVEEASLGATTADVLKDVFGVTDAHAALPPEGVEGAPRTDHLVALLGEEEADELKTTLQACLDEGVEIAEDLDEEWEKAEWIAENEEFCAEDQTRSVEIALLDKRLAAVEARRTAIQSMTEALNAETAEIMAQTAETQSRNAERRETLADVEFVHAELTELLVNRAICELQGKADECSAMDDRIEALFAKSRALLAPFQPEDGSEPRRTASL